MHEEAISVDVSNSAELLRLAEEVHTSGTPRLLRRGDEPLAVLTPALAEAPPKLRRRRRRKPGKPRHWLYNIVGIVDTPGPGDISENKHKYLAQAYYEKSHPPEE
jgi:hypothetical protein